MSDIELRIKSHHITSHHINSLNRIESNRIDCIRYCELLSLSFSRSLVFRVGDGDGNGIGAGVRVMCICVGEGRGNTIPFDRFLGPGNRSDTRRSDCHVLLMGKRGKAEVTGIPE